MQLSGDDGVVVGFDAPAGGVATVEAGAVTGRLVCRVAGRVASVAYAGSTDWYRVPGCLPDGVGAGEVAGWLAVDPGLDAAGNPVPGRLLRR